jgi:glycosyltransferase involved in cell wall biosynthesis
MKILLLTDKPNWAFDSIAKNLVKYNTDKGIELSIHPIKGREKEIKKKYKKYDLFYVMGFQTYERINFLPKDRTMVGIHSCHSWDNKKTTPTNVVKPDKALVAYLNTFLRVDAVSKYLYDLFNEAGVESLYYTPNGVDSELFRPHDGIREGFTVGYSGTKTHDWRKGISEFILPAAKKAGVKVNLAMRIKGETIPLEEMPAFYNTLDAYICASASEGFSLSVLEAASCGVPIISTRVTGCTELIKHRVNGLFVDRDVDDIVKKIRRLQDPKYRNWMSQNMREDIVKHHCWSKKVNSWMKFFRGF